MNPLKGRQNETVKVECLQHVCELKKTCKMLGLKFRDSRKHFLLVDMVVNDKLLRKRTLYQVKYEGFGSKFSWVPKSELPHCQSLINYYENLKSPATFLSDDMVLDFVSDLVTRSPLDILTLTKLLSLVHTITGKITNKGQFNFQYLKTEAMQVLQIPVEDFHGIRHEMFKLMKFSEKRKLYLLSIKKWEEEINASASQYIEVENNVDFDKLPRKFVFVQDYVSSFVDLSKDPVVFCACNDCYKEKGHCCSHDLDGCLAYKKDGRVQLYPGYPIYECNKFCKCDENCVNRVVQHGQKVRVSIFKTNNGCGWGLKTLDLIEKDKFVLEYIGEVIPSDEAERRGELYNYTHKSYLFNMTLGEGYKYMVDSHFYGNASRFINHSCSPNLQVYTVWIDQQDPDLPRLAFFSTRAIRPGEELTFDYQMIDDGSPIPEEARVRCRCNSKNCRKYLF